MEKTANDKEEPYSFTQYNDYDTDPAKKTFFVVDSETNSSVDVKRLGKWGQAYVAWRGRREKRGK